MVKTSAVAVLILSLATQPLQAASLDAGPPPAGERSMGAFAGARVRLSLGAAPKASAAIAIAPMQRATTGDGAVRMRFGEGLSFGTDIRGPVALRLAGTRVDRLGIASNGKVDERAGKHGISTVGYVAIGVGVLAVVALALYVGCGTGEICNTDDE